MCSGSSADVKYYCFRNDAQFTMNSSVGAKIRKLCSHSAVYLCVFVLRHLLGSTPIMIPGFCLRIEAGIGLGGPPVSGVTVVSIHRFVFPQIAESYGGSNFQ